MPSPTRPDPGGLAWAITSAVLWSTTFLFARVLTHTHHLDGLTLSAIRFGIGAVCLLAPALTLFRRRFLAVSRADLARLAGLSLLGMGGMSVLLFCGQALTTASTAALLMQLAPVLTLVLAAVLGERVRTPQWVGIVLGFLGCLLIGEVWRAHGHWRGDLLVLASATCWAVYTVLGRGVVHRVGGYAATTWAMVFGGAVLLGLRVLLPALLPHLALTWPAPRGELWWPILYLGLCPTGLAFFAWYEALDRLALPLVNVIQYAGPPCTLLLAWWWLHEAIGPMQWLGIAAMAAGIVLTSLRNPNVPDQKFHASEALTERAR
jgi:drug/metabolite transporter (DMT)-like permease